MINFWWVRHAPVVGNFDRCYGNNEVDCDVSDIFVFKKLVKNLPKNADVYTSNLSRTIKTFEAAVKSGYKFKKHITDDRLAEQDLGEYTGMKYSALYNLAKTKKFHDKNWLISPSHIPPNGESFKNLYARVKSFIDDILIKNKKKNIVIFSHGGPIRAAISYAIDYSENIVIPIDVENTKLSLIGYNKNKEGKLFFLNR